MKFELLTSGGKRIRDFNETPEHCIAVNVEKSLGEIPIGESVEALDYGGYVPPGVKWNCRVKRTE